MLTLQCAGHGWFWMERFWCHWQGAGLWSKTLQERDLKLWEDRHCPGSKWIAYQHVTAWTDCASGLVGSGYKRVCRSTEENQLGLGGGGGGGCQQCPEITYMHMAMGFWPHSFLVGGMYVKGIGRLTKVEKNHSLLFSIASLTYKVLHKSFVFTSLGKKYQSEKHRTSKPNRFATIPPNMLVSCTCPMLRHHRWSWLCRLTEGSAIHVHETGS